MSQFARIFVSDLRSGLPAVALRLVAVVFTVLMCGLASWLEMRGALWQVTSNIPPLSFGDSVVCLLGGMEVFVPGASHSFIFPVSWMAVLAVMAYATLDWPLHDLEGFGARLIVANGSRWRWWLSKCAWVVVVALLIWLVVVAVAALLTLATGGDWSATPNPAPLIALGLWEPTGSINLGSLAAFALAALPVLVAVLVTQMAFSLLFGPALALCSALAVLYASAFLAHPLLVGNYLMAARSQAVLGSAGMVPWVGVVLAAVIMVLAVVGGGLLFVRADILGRKDS